MTVQDNIEMLKKDLAIAVREKDYVRVAELRQLLHITDEQAKYFERGLTGYPSIDQTWLKYYSKNAFELANDIPVNKTVWDVIEEKLLEYYDIPAIEYFKREFSRQEFIDLCYTWARTFRAMGVAENEIVPVYGILVPDICAMIFALNMIGACPYFLKLAISDEALAEECQEAKIAVVYDGMWKNVAKEFMKDKYKNIIVANVSVDMPSPKKQIVSFLDKMNAIKNKSLIPNEKKYIWSDKAREIAHYYSGDVKVPFVKDRKAFITSSSGTTIDGVVKGTVATNESTLVQLQMGKASEIQYFVGDRCLNSLPPTASTSLNVLFMYGLYNGLTVLIDPRVSEKDFYNQIIKLKPNIALTTGSIWEAFFNRVASEMKQGKKFDFSYAKGWVVGGEGTDVKKYQRWMDLMEKADVKARLFSGYGSSEVFSAASVEKVDARYDFSKQIMSVGIPYAGMNMGVFDENGKELLYGQRGELWMKSNTAMKEYYNKPELTAKTKIDGWIHSGDLAEFDENGFLYIWGRLSDKIILDDNTCVYMFDIANKIKESRYIDDAIVLKMPTIDNDNNLVAHIVLNENHMDDKPMNEIIDEINELMREYLPGNIVLDSYCVHEGMLPYSPTTLKKDKNKMAKQLTGYFNYVDGVYNEIEYILVNSGKFIKKCDILINDSGKVKTYKRK